MRRLIDLPGLGTPRWQRVGIAVAVLAWPVIVVAALLAL